VGFRGAQRHLGIDEQGRDLLSWVEGDVSMLRSASSSSTSR
jgi:hypothetical protein